MRSLLRRAAAVLVGLSVAATASEAAAQVTPEPPPLAVAVSPAPGVWGLSPHRGPGPLAVAVSPAPETPPGMRMPDRAEVGLGAIAVGLGLTDAGFIVYDAVTAAHGGRPMAGAAVAEIVVAAPQALVFDIGHAVLVAGAGEKDHELAPLVLVPGVVNTMILHGGLSMTSIAQQPYALLGASFATGFDLALTLPAVAAATQGRLFPRSLGAVEMALTAPQMAVALHALGKDPHDAPSFAPIAVWSSALFVHGVLSLAVPRSLTPPPAPPEPTKRPLLVPSSIAVAPVTLAGGGGVSVSGRWD